MSAETRPGYTIQVLEHRYVKIKVLESFLENNVEAFGAERSVEVARDNKITLVVLRELTKDEILDIQKRSFPQLFQEPFV